MYVHNSIQSLIITCIIAQKALSSGIQGPLCIGVQTVLEVVVFSSMFLS